jgi:hypothetical protein
MNGYLKLNFWGVACVTLLASAQPIALRAQAPTAETELSKTSLALAPQDAAFYAASLNMRAAWEGFLKSNFVTRLRNVPFAQKLETEFYEQWAMPQGALQQFKSQMQNQNVRDLIDLAIDMGSHEAFIYGGNDWCEFIDGLMALYSDLYDASIDGPEAVREFIQEIDHEYADAISIPTTIAGWRLSDDKIARTQLDALEGILRLAGNQVPEFQPLLKQLIRKDFADGQMLSFVLSADLIPLDAIEGDERELFENLVKAFEGRKLTIALAVKDNVLLLAIGEGKGLIDSIGKGPALLDHPRMEVLRNEPPKNFRTVSYASEDWRASQWNANFGSYFTRMFSQFAGAIEGVENEKVDVDNWQALIAEDAALLDETLAEFSPKFDAVISWSFASPIGREGFTYDWSENLLRENATPMSILRHAGTSPLFLSADKWQKLPVLNDLIEIILERAPDHIQNFILLAEQDEEQQETALELLEKGWTILDDAYRILRDSILPAIDDREILFSLAANWTTNQLSEQLPVASQPLPLPEFAGAITLRNRDEFLAGCSEMFDIFDQITELVRQVSPDAVPADYKVPRPQQQQLAGATKFFYPEIRLPITGFAPQIVVSKNVVVVGYSERQVQDLLERKPLTSRPAWLTADMPVASMRFADLAGMVAAIRPWLSYAMEISLGDLDSPIAEDNGPVPTGNDILQMWDCLSAFGKTASTTVIDEAGATVVRWVWVGE